MTDKEQALVDLSESFIRLLNEEEIMNPSKAKLIAEAYRQLIKNIIER